MSLIKDTLFAKYIKSRKNEDILENEFGFIIYHLGQQECFIAEMHVDESHRRQGHAVNLFNQLIKIATENKCQIISANIHLADKDHPKILNAALKVGCELSRAEHGILLLTKKLGEQNG